MFRKTGRDANSKSTVPETENFWRDAKAGETAMEMERVSVRDFPRLTRLGLCRDETSGTGRKLARLHIIIIFLRCFLLAQKMPLSLPRAVTSLRRPRLPATPRGLLVPPLPQLHSRNYRIGPPYLLDEYIPRYHLISSIDAAKKRSQAYAHLRNCNLCPRLCGVNRYEKTGLCLIGAETVKVNVIAPHFGEGC